MTTSERIRHWELPRVVNWSGRTLPFLFLLLAVALTRSAVRLSGMDLSFGMTSAFLATWLAALILAISACKPVVARVWREGWFQFLRLRLNRLEMPKNPSVVEMGVGPYADTAIVPFSKPPAAIAPHVENWAQLVESFWSRKVLVGWHNQLLLYAAPEERGAYFIPLYLFKGNFVLVSTELITNAHVPIEETSDIEENEFLLTRIARNHWRRVLDAAPIWKYASGADLKWILRETLLEAGFSGTEIDPRLKPWQQLGTEIDPLQTADVVSVGADEAFSLIQRGSHVLLSSSKDFSHASVDGIVLHPDLPDEWLKAIYEAAKLWLRMISLLRRDAQDYLDEIGGWSGALVRRYRDYVAGPGRLVVPSEEIGIACALLSCIDPAPAQSRGWNEWLVRAGESIVTLSKSSGGVKIQYRVHSVKECEILSLNIRPILAVDSTDQQ